MVVVKSLQDTNKYNIIIIFSLIHIIIIIGVPNMMGTIDKVFFFYPAHPKQQNVLEKTIDDTQPESSIHKVKDLCRT